MRQYYYGYWKNDQIIESASGGVARAFYEYVLKNSGIVYGVSWDKDFREARYMRVTNTVDLVCLQGSKYIKASMVLENKNSLYESVKIDLENDELVLIVGLPCEINGLITYLEKNRTNVEKLISVDMICQGPVKNDIYKEYLKYLEKKFRAKIISVNMRYKNPIWGKSFLRILFDNGKEYIKELYKTGIGIAIAYMCEECSFYCKCKDDNRKSDITIGDYWGITENDDEYFSNGMSIIVINSDKGSEFIFNLPDIFLSKRMNGKKILENNPYYYVPREKTNQHKSFSSDYSKYGLNIALMRTLGVKKILSYYLPFLYRLMKCMKGKLYNEKS